MSDHWNLYYAEIAGQRAVIIFDDGVGPAFDRKDWPNLARVQVAFRCGASTEIPHEDEIAPLIALEDKLEEAIAGLGGRYVGRVTARGLRTFFYYTAASRAETEEVVVGVAEAQGYELGFRMEADPCKRVYWDELCPSREERRMMENLKVIYQLQESGDDLNCARRIEHHLFFHNRLQRDLFMSWARKNGYGIQRTFEQAGQVNRMAIVLHHECRPLPDEIGQVTMALAGAAEQLGGAYDGWDTQLAQRPH